MVEKTEKLCVDCGAVLARNGSIGRFPKRCAPCVESRRIAYMAEWNTRPDVREKKKARSLLPEQQAKRAAYRRDCTCKHCGTLFPANSFRAFCSTGCRADFEAAARSLAEKKKERVCLGCGVTFVPRLAKYGKYCSKACAHSSGACQKHRGDYLTGEGPNSKVYFKTCAECGSTFTSNNSASRLCSKECNKVEANRKCLERNTAKHVERQLICPECRKTIVTQYGDKKRKFCSPECSKRHNGRISKMRRRARERGVGSDRIDPLIVFDIYGWECFQCKTPTPKALRGTCEPNAPELDHIHPLSKGGPHTYPNVQLLCRKCNGEKRDT